MPVLARRGEASSSAALSSSRSAALRPLSCVAWSRDGNQLLAASPSASPSPSAAAANASHLPPTLHFWSMRPAGRGADGA